MQPPPNWTPPLKTLFIASSMRSGSSYLMHLIGRTGVLGTPSEYFNPQSLAKVSPLEGCYSVQTKGQTANGVASTKIFAAQMYYANKVIDFNQWFPQQEWVWLRRRDKLAQAISLTIAKQTIAWHSELPTVNDPIYNRADVTLNMTFLKSEELWWSYYFWREKILPLQLWYEDILQDPITPLRSIARLCDAELPGSPNLEAPIGIQRTQVNADWADRYLHESGNPLERIWSYVKLRYLWREHSWPAPKFR